MPPEMSPFLRRAVMRAWPDYFRLSEREQEAWRISMPAGHDFLIDRQLLRDLFGIEVENHDSLRDAHRDLSEVQQNRYNEAVLPIRGIGDDCFWLNEYLHGKTLADFDTLHDWALHSHETQEDFREEENPDHARRPYRGSLYADWARLFIDGAFTYGVLYSAAGYLLTQIEDCGNEVIDRLIPHRYVSGPDDGKPENGGVLCDTRIEADGREEVLAELRDRFYAYQTARYDELQEEWDRRAQGQCFMLDTSRIDDPEMTFVFSDKTALQAVRLRHFMTDCRRIEADPASLSAARVEEQERVERHLIEQLAEIEANHDPKVRRLRKRRKIIMAPGALDALRDRS